jgi:hypothetical protein
MHRRTTALGELKVQCCSLPYEAPRLVRRFAVRGVMVMVMVKVCGPGPRLHTSS